MARIKIEDLPKDIKISKKELRQVMGGTIGSIYFVRIGKDDHAYIQFGDGKSGARLPTGSGNISSAYRSGISGYWIPLRQLRKY